MHCMHAATFEVENSAQGSSCQLKFVLVASLTHNYYTRIEVTVSGTLSCYNKKINYGRENICRTRPFQPSLLFREKHSSLLRKP